MCVAFASIFSNTGSNWPGELEMTCRTSEVAVCCCNNSRSSLSRRRILDGDDGLRGEVLDQLDLLFGEGPDLGAVDGDAAN